MLSEKTRNKIATAARKRWAEVTAKSAKAEESAGAARPKKRASTPASSSSRDGADPSAVAGLSEAGSRGQLLSLDPAIVRRSPFNREDFDEEKLADLVADVLEHGIIQPGLVRPVDPPDGAIRFEIIAGERRWRAATAAKRPFPATVRAATDREVLELQAIENMYREDLNPMDEARKFRQLQECYEKEGMGRQEATEHLAATTGKAMATIYERLALLKLPPAVVTLVQSGKLPASHAGLLLKIQDPAAVASKAAEICAPKASRLERGAIDTERGILSYRAAKELVADAVQREKQFAEYERLKATFEGTVLPEKECAAILHSYGNGAFYLRKSETYVDPDSACYSIGANGRHWNKLWKKPPPLLLARTEDGKAVVLCRKADAERAVKEGGKLQKTKANGRPLREKSAEELAREKRQADHDQEYDRAVTAILAKIENMLDSNSKEFWTFFAIAQMRSRNLRELGAIAKRRGWPAQAGVDHAALAEQIRKCGVHELRALCVHAMLLRDEPNHWDTEWGNTLIAACELTGVKLLPWKAKAGSADDLQASGAAPEEEADSEDEDE